MKENTVKNVVSGGLTAFILLVATYGVERLGSINIINMDPNMHVHPVIDNWFDGMWTLLMGSIICGVLYFIVWVVYGIFSLVKDKL